MISALPLNKARTLLQQPLFIKLGLVPTWLLLGLSRALILTLSFKRLTPWLGAREGPAPWVPLLNRRQETRGLQIGRVVRLAARYTPWDSNCFAQALTARLLLGLYGLPYALYFGLARDSSTGEMQAHTWVCAGRIRVTGGAGFNRYTTMGLFVGRRGSPRSTASG